MPVENFFKTLSARKDKRETLRRTPAVRKCPNATGDIIVGVYRGKDFSPLSGIATAVTGPGAGATATDAMGLAMYLDRTPGDYRYQVTYGPQQPAHTIQNASAGFSLPANAVVVQTSWILEEMTWLEWSVKDVTGRKPVAVRGCEAEFTTADGSVGLTSAAAPARVAFEKAGPDCQFDAVTMPDDGHLYEFVEFA